ncbi:two-component system OmpR family sensor kinase [Curtobacterium luteum]|uniref:histidine kinase n=1 Tax=Curtobacterium luteum TaxID=33881 RepID=A0A7Y6BA81_9MICO|nr:two-component system OmpR family sensor kinase [Curtobacterium luteum]NUU50291.1 HAMP domain-containing histidine kinase [Curtobacterium luteum]NUU50392.1 HAMP domain-containing histidine kinase [Curtobacterium luteum]GGL06694.1 two-component sensor histidine kinase [Curtobacterium luteum]
MGSGRGRAGAEAGARAGAEAGAGRVGSGRAPSLRWRIVGAVALLLVVTNVVVGAVTVVAFREYLVGRLDAELATAAGRVVGDGGAPPSGSSGSGSSGSGSSGSGSSSDGPDPDNRFIGVPGQAAGTVVAVFRSGSTALAGYTDSEGRQHGLTTAQRRTLAAIDHDGSPVTVRLGSLGSYRAQAVGNGDDVYVTALPLGSLDATIVRLAVVFGGVTLLGLAVATWALALTVRRALRPLERVAGVASDVAALDLERGDTDITARVATSDLTANREVGQVGTALNRLLGHVGRALTVRREAEAGMRTFVADASHELRTPIATVRAYAELSASSHDLRAVHANVDRIATEAVRMGDLVEELLLLARLDARTLAGSAPLVVEALDLTSIVVEATMDARTTAPGHRWTLEVDAEPVTVDGDAGQLRRLVRNLLANAASHTPDGTAVVVSLQRVRGEGQQTVRLVVANDGPPIDPALLPTLFDRFTRGEASRSREHGTSGLGLAIVQAVAQAHGGSVRVVSGPGRTAFTVDLTHTASSGPSPAQ